MTHDSAKIEHIGFNHRPPEMRCVAFLDVLGFGSKIVDNFESTVELYDELIWGFRLVQSRQEHLKVSIRIFSDSILLVSAEAYAVVQAACFLQWQALLCDCLLRGDVAFGKHAELTENENIFVVSEPLVHAAKIEKDVSYPCVALHDSIVSDINPYSLVQIPLQLRSWHVK